jgi:hypothetical protein
MLQEDHPHRLPRQIQIGNYRLKHATLNTAMQRVSNLVGTSSMGSIGGVPSCLRFPSGILSGRSAGLSYDASSAEEQAELKVPVYGIVTLSCNDAGYQKEEKVCCGQ